MNNGMCDLLLSVMVQVLGVPYIIIIVPHCYRLTSEAALLYV